MIAALAFILGIIIGNATKANLYAAMCNVFIKVWQRRERKFERLIRAKNEVISELKNGKAT